MLRLCFSFDTVGIEYYENKSEKCMKKCLFILFIRIILAFAWVNYAIINCDGSINKQNIIHVLVGICGQKVYVIIIFARVITTS